MRCSRVRPTSASRAAALTVDVVADGAGVTVDDGPGAAADEGAAAAGADAGGAAGGACGWSAATPMRAEMAASTHASPNTRRTPLLYTLSQRAATRWRARTVDEGAAAAVS